MDFQALLFPIARRKIRNMHRDSIKNAIKLYNDTINEVSAYCIFLKEKGASVKKINSFQEFRALPIIDKTSYLSRFNIFDRSIKSAIKRAHSLEGSSGYSGATTFFLRSPEEDYQTRKQFEFLLRTIGNVDRRSTLFINCYAFGIWPSGEKVSRLIKEIGYKKRYSLLSVNPGPDINTVISILEVFSSYYDQVIITGYPPFIKNLIEKVNRLGFHKKIKVYINTGGEGFPEGLRDYLAQLLEISDERDIIQRIQSSYGVTEFGRGTGFETPLSIKIRRACFADHSVANEVFSRFSNMTPMLFQYNPINFFAEAVNNEVIASTRSISPLVRYNIHDLGDVITFQRMKTELLRFDIDIEKIIGTYEGSLQLMMKFPFLLIAGRSDGGVTFRGANVYIENIKGALSNKHIARHHTGRFIVEKKENQNQEPIISILIELKKDIKGSESLREDFRKIITKEIQENNREFADAVTHINYTPIIIDFIRGNMSSGIKNKYVNNREE
ncbi:MAG: hypothetical protein WC505_06485 [Patescibacteria group bacterium]